MAFNNYLEDENDKPYFTKNSLAYYYDKMEGFAKAVEGSAKALNLTKEEIEQRIALRLAEWDKNLENFDGSVEKLLTEWVDDGTLTPLIDSTLIDRKVAPLAIQLTETEKKLSGMNQRVDNLAIPLGEENANIQVTDAQTSTTKATTFGSIGLRMDEIEKEAKTIITESNNKFFERYKMENQSITTLGVLEPSDSYFSYINIKVSPNSFISVKGANRIVYLTNEKTYHSNQNIAHTGYNGVIPNGAQWASFRCQRNEAAANTPQLNFTQSLLEYDVPVSELNVLVDLTKTTGKLKNQQMELVVPTQNVLTYEDVLWNTGFNSVGGALIENNDQYHCSVLIPVKPGDVITVLGVNRIQTYNAELTTSGGLNMLEAYHNPVTYTIPTGRYFVRVRWEKQYTGNQQIVFGSSIGTRQSIYDKLQPLDLSNQPDILDIKEAIENTGMSNIYRELNTSLEGVYNAVKPTTDYTNFASVTAQEVDNLFNVLAVQYPEYITKISGGTEATGLPLYAYSLRPKLPSSGSYGKLPTIFINCGIHGYEHMNPLATYLMVKNMCEKWQEHQHLETLRFNVNMIIVPVANPYGFNNFIRKNSNNIDLNRNCDTSNWTLQDPSAVNYGGAVKGSEPETKFIMKLIDENEIDILYDFHNFQAAEPANDFIWIPTGRTKEMRVAEPFIAKMTRKWSKDFSFVDSNVFVGYTNQTNAGGSVSDYAREKGVSFASTLEIRDRWVNDPAGVPYDGNVCKSGEETIVNWLIFNLRALL